MAIISFKVLILVPIESPMRLLLTYILSRTHVAQCSFQQYKNYANGGMVSMCHSTTGDSAFLVPASRVWNSLPSGVTSSTSLIIFRQRLTTELFLWHFGPECVWRLSSCFSVSCLTPISQWICVASYVRRLTLWPWTNVLAVTCWNSMLNLSQIDQCTPEL